MAKSILDIAIKLTKEGGGEKETVSALQNVKSGLANLTMVAGAVVAAWYTIDKVLDATVGKFYEYATGVDVFHSALSTTTEEASKLIQVADDFGISSDEMQTAMFRAVKEGMEPTIEGLAGMADEYNALATPQEKADFLVKNFGKSSQDLTLMLAEGGQALRDRAGAIEDSLVLDEAAIKKANDYRDAQDGLHDSIDAIKIAIGQELIPVITSVVTQLNDGATKTDLFKQAQKLGLDVSHEYYTGAIELNGAIVTQNDLLAAITTAQNAAGVATYYLAGGATEAEIATAKLSKAFNTNFLSAEDLDKKYDDLYSTINTFQGIYDTFAEKTGDITTKMDALKIAIGEATGKGDENKAKVAELQEKYDELQTELDDTAAAYEDESKRAIYAMLVQKAGADDWQTGEMEALWKVGEAWGILSGGVIAQGINIEAALAKVKTGEISLDNFQNYSEWMIAHPKIDMTYEYWFVVHGGPPDVGDGGGEEIKPPCFIAGTPVTMADGSSKPIEAVRIGEWVLGWDTEMNKPVAADVCRIFQHGADEMVGYILVNGTLGVTPEHPLFINRKWREAGNLHPGDCLMDANGRDVVVEKWEWIKKRLPVYNLQIGHTHNYFAGGVLAHNKIKMEALGGDYWVTRPTLFLAGEAGPERATFTPQGAVGPISPLITAQPGNLSANVPEIARLTRAVEQSGAAQIAKLNSIQNSLEDLPGQLAAEIQKRR